MKKLDYLCNHESEISNVYNAVEGYCLQAFKIMRNTKDLRLSILRLVFPFRGRGEWGESNMGRVVTVAISRYSFIARPLFFMTYTLLQNKRWRWCTPPHLHLFFCKSVWLSKLINCYFILNLQNKWAVIGI